MVVRTGGSRGLWERGAELDAIEDALAGGAAGDGGVLVVRGPAGIGKSALLRVARRLAGERGMIALWARAAPFERGFPYGVVRQLFEPVLAREDAGGEGLFSGAAAGARGVLAGEPGQGAVQDASFASLHGLYWLTANLASHAPLLMCVDDVGWCDEPSLRFLEFLVRRLEGMAVCVVLGFRPGEGESSERAAALLLDPLARVVTPAPLTEAALAEILADELEGEVDRRFCAACREATGGNPLLVGELVRALQAEGVRPRAGEIARLQRIGAIAVAPAVRRRLDLAGEHAQAVARALAVLGDSVRNDDLAGTAGVGGAELGDLLAALVGAGIVRSDDRVSFVHPLVAEAVRASLGSAERARLHEQAVHVLQQRGASAWELAPHVMTGAVGAHPGVMGVLRQAARWALATGAPEAAVTYLNRAQAELDPGDDPASLLLELGGAKLQSGDPTATEQLGRAIELGRDARTRAMARTALSVALFAGGQFMSSIQVLEQGIDEVAPEDPELARRMEANLLVNFNAAGPGLSDPPASISERVTRMRSARYPRPSLSGRLALCALAYEERLGGGHAADAIALADQGLGDGTVLSAEGPASPSFYNAIITLVSCDELERAAAILTVALGEARRLASVTGFCYASLWRGAANLRRGQLLESEADARAALDSGPQQSLTSVAPASAILALSLIAQGRLDEARATANEIPEPNPTSAFTFWRLYSRAILNLARGEYEAAARDLERGRELYDRIAGLVAWRKPVIGIFEQRSLLAQALLGLGEIDSARALVEEERPLAHALGTHRAIGVNLHTAGLLARGEAQLQTLKRATEELGRSQSRLEYAEALCDYGAALRRANRRSEARAPLREARQLARGARAKPLHDRAVQELRATGERIGRTDATGVDALTASEQRIASMAATGASNHDIAQALFVTVKTVETHLGHVYQKLGVTGRRQLAHALGEPGTSPESRLDAQLAQAHQPIA
jgi:DNA-binding CsgD family transcriptional regulator